MHALKPVFVAAEPPEAPTPADAAAAETPSVAPETPPALAAVPRAVRAHAPSVTLWILSIAMLLAFSVLNAVNGPALESLVCTGVSPHHLARRLAVYNLVWPGVSAVTVALTGTVLERWSLGLFAIAALTNFGSGVVLLLSSRKRGDDAGTVAHALGRPREEGVGQADRGRVGRRPAEGRERRRGEEPAGEPDDEDRLGCTEQRAGEPVEA